MTIRPPDLSRLLSLRAQNGFAGEAMAAQAERFHRLKHRHENGTAPCAVFSWQLIQTRRPLAERMAALRAHIAPLCVLEPSAGLGRLLDAVASYNSAELIAVEMAESCAAELRKREGLRVIQRDFLAVDPQETGLVDLVLMNPPFHMRADIRHIQHARKFLLPGGLLVAICMNTRNREEALKPLSDSWEELPEGTFKESNTNVGTVLLTIRN